MIQVTHKTKICNFFFCKNAFLFLHPVLEWKGSHSEGGKEDGETARSHI